MTSCSNAPLPTPASTMLPAKTAGKSGDLLSPSELAWISGNLNTVHPSITANGRSKPQPHLKAAWVVQKGLPLPAVTPRSGKGSASAGDDDDGIGQAVLAQQPKRKGKQGGSLPPVRVKVDTRPRAVQPMQTGLLQQLVSAESGEGGGGGGE